MKERLDSVEAGISEVLMHYISDEKRDKLNTLLAEKHGLRVVYDLVEELKEELEEGLEPVASEQ